jgi:hypothetical protein
LKSQHSSITRSSGNLCYDDLLVHPSLPLHAHTDARRNSQCHALEYVPTASGKRGVLQRSISRNSVKIRTFLSPFFDSPSAKPSPDQPESTQLRNGPSNFVHGAVLPSGCSQLS